MPAVVIIATVDAPMAIFRMAAMMKGMSTPMPVLVRLPTESAMGRHFRIAPKEPPAQVMARMPAESVTPWVTHFRVFSFSDSGIRLMDRNTPSSNATSGLPMKAMNLKKTPVPKGLPGKEATEARAMRMMGRMMGAKLCTAPGSLPYLLCSSS